MMNKKDIEAIGEIYTNHFALTQSYTQLLEDIKKLGHKDVNDLIDERVVQIFENQMKLLGMKKIGKGSWVSTKG